MKSGKRFRVEILKKIPWNDATINNLRYWESYYLDYFGGYDNTYNTGAIPLPNYSYSGCNDVTLPFDVDADILEHLETVGNKQGYIKSLIRRDIENKK